MTKGYCEKDKNGKIHDCERCVLKKYSDDYVCNHYIPNGKNYIGSLKEVEGKKVRNELFFSVFGVVSIAIFLLLFIFFRVDSSFLANPLNYALAFPVLALSLIVALVERAVGKTVAKYTSDGIYTKQGFVKWQDIKSAEYSFYNYISMKMQRSFIQESCIKISTKDKSYFIFNPPILFLRTIKKNNKSIRLSINKKSISYQLTVIGLLILLILIAPSFV